MKEQSGVDVSIFPQLDKACGLDVLKDKIVGFILSKDGSSQDLREFGTFSCELRQVKVLQLVEKLKHENKTSYVMAKITTCRYQSFL